MRLFRRKALTGTPEAVETLASRQLQPYVSLGGTNINTARIKSVFVQGQMASYGWLYAQQPAVRSVIDYIARNIAQLSLDVYEHVADGEVEKRDDHPAAKALQNPNSFTPGQKLIFDLVASFLIYDNAYLLKMRAGPGEPLVMLNLPPSAVGILGNERFQAAGYRIYLADGTFFDRPVDDVLHWRGFHPEDPRVGFSKLETLRNELSADATAAQAKTELDQAGLIPKGWIERPVEASEWSQEAQQRFMEGWANWARNSTRRTPVLEDGMTFKQSSVSPEDAQLLESRKFTQQEVCREYGLANIPPANEEERRQAYADVFAPMCEMLCAYLDLSVLKGEYAEDDLFTAFNLDEKLRGEPIARWAALTSTSGTPWQTINEVREKEGLPPIEGGNVLARPLNVQYSNEPPEQKPPALPAPNVMPIQDPNKPPQDGSHRTDVPTPVPAGGNQNGKQLTESKQFHISTVPARFGDQTRQRRNVEKATSVFLQHYNRQANNMLLKVGPAKPADSERWNRELAGNLAAFLKSVFEIEGSIYVARLGGVDFDIGRREHWIAATAAGIAEAVNIVTQRDIEQFGIEEALARARGERASVAGASVGASATREARYEAAAQAPHP